MAENQKAGVCACPPELDELDLIALADHEAGQDVLEHVAACPHCRERAMGVSELQGQLRARLYRLFCPPTEELADFLQGLLSPAPRAQMLAHIAECPHCQEELAMLEQVGSSHVSEPPGGPPTVLSFSPSGDTAQAVRRATSAHAEGLVQRAPPQALPRGLSGTPSGFSLMRIHDHIVIVDAHFVA